jgi:hypothetical protein
MASSNRVIAALEAAKVFVGDPMRLGDLDEAIIYKHSSKRVGALAGMTADLHREQVDAEVKVGRLLETLQREAAGRPAVKLLVASALTTFKGNSVQVAKLGWVEAGSTRPPTFVAVGTRPGGDLWSDLPLTHEDRDKDEDEDDDEDDAATASGLALLLSPCHGTLRRLLLSCRLLLTSLLLPVANLDKTLCVFEPAKEFALSSEVRGDVAKHFDNYGDTAVRIREAPAASLLSLWEFLGYAYLRMEGPAVTPLAALRKVPAAFLERIRSFMDAWRTDPYTGLPQPWVLVLNITGSFVLPDERANPTSYRLVTVHYVFDGLRLDTSAPKPEEVLPADLRGALPRTDMSFVMHHRRSKSCPDLKFLDVVQGDERDQGQAVMDSVLEVDVVKNILKMYLARPEPML